MGDQEAGLEWWNFAFLFTITVMPFTSTLLGDFVRNPLAVDIFALNLLIASLATRAMIVMGAAGAWPFRMPRPRPGG